MQADMNINIGVHYMLQQHVLVCMHQVEQVYVYKYICTFIYDKLSNELIHSREIPIYSSRIPIPHSTCMPIKRPFIANKSKQCTFLSPQKNVVSIV